MGIRRMSALTNGASVTPRWNADPEDMQRSASRATAHIEDPPARDQPRGSDDEPDRPLRFGVVPVRIELEIFLSEPFLEPFGHRDGSYQLIPYDTDVRQES